MKEQVGKPLVLNDSWYVISQRICTIIYYKLESKCG